jgi:hypothetical protein
MSKLIIVLLSVASVFLSLNLYTINNDFPVNYHPDEEGKANQIIGNQSRNFNQPLLMIETDRFVNIVFHTREDVRSIVLSGRWTSAVFSSITILSLALASMWKKSSYSMILTGITLLLCPPLLVVSHYMKEDTVLIAGIAISVLGARIVLSKEVRQQLLGCVVLGLGCAVAASGKYVGICVILPIFISLFISCRPKLIPIRLLIFGLVAALLIVLFNARGFDSYFPPRPSSVFIGSIMQEFHHGTEGHDFVAIRTPNIYCIGIALSQLLPHQITVIAMGLIFILIKMNVTKWGIVVASFFLTMSVILSFDAVPIERYALPLVVLGYFIASELFLYLVPYVKSKPVKHGITWAWAFMLLVQGYVCYNFTHQFYDDSRQRLREWIASNLPASSIVGIDRPIMLSSTGDAVRFPNQAQLPQRIKSSKYAADLFDSGASDVQYLAITNIVYDRYLMNNCYGVFPKEEDFIRRRDFYLDIITHGKLIWESSPGIPTRSYVNPVIKLYELP